MRFRILILSLVLITSCQNTVGNSFINSGHLDNLYKEITGAPKAAAFVYIYAEYPDYKPIEAAGEGIACVDDAARAAIFYFRYYQHTSNNEYLKKGKSLIRFVINMQAENGYFYNFIKADFTINTVRINSQAIADWWTWRALWAFSEAMLISKETDPAYYNMLLERFNFSLEAFTKQDTLSGIIKNLAGDQASVLLMALTNYYTLTADSSIIIYLNQLAQNIISTQRGDEDNFPYYAFMSWRNEWHGWGNTQAYALLLTGQALHDTKMIETAKNEVDYLYPYLEAKMYLNRFVLGTSEADSELNQFEQIAYAFRPMVWAALELHKISGEDKYAEQAGRLAAWLAGENIVERPVYDPLTGRCFDGINSAAKINLNSGAESTIEALLILLAVEQSPKANAHVKKTFNEFQK